MVRAVLKCRERYGNKIYNIDTYNVPLQKEEDNFVNGDTEWDIEGKGNIWADVEKWIVYQLNK